VATKSCQKNIEERAMNDDLTKYIDRQKRIEIITVLVGLVTVVAAIVLTLIWFGWQLLLVIFLFLFSNNIAQRNDR
jgi:fatty acid desaturase